MKYTKEERLDIGRRIYDGEISKFQAAELYEISFNTARDYMRLYRDMHNLPARKTVASVSPSTCVRNEPAGMEELESMTKEELIREVMRARIREARLKKGYEVKGDGTVILYEMENIK